MEVTKEMYELSKKIVNEYDNKDSKKILIEQLEELFNKNNNLNPKEDGIMMPCCGEKYVFSYARMKHLPRNPYLKYRETQREGDVLYDEKSNDARFVDYNNLREAIRQAKKKGLYHIHWKMSIAVSEKIKQDGYIDHNDGLDTISW